MNTYHSPNSQPENNNACSASNSNKRKTIPEAITLALATVLSYLWDITSLSSELRIRQRRDRFGQMYWQVYDPIHNRSNTFDSEQEVRRWLEQRYYTNK